MSLNRFHSSSCTNNQCENTKHSLLLFHVIYISYVISVSRVMSCKYFNQSNINVEQIEQWMCFFFHYNLKIKNSSKRNELKKVNASETLDYNIFWNT